MTQSLGPGVSRVLDPTGTQYTEVILQQGKPPLDAEFNLLQELATDYSKRIVLRGSPSGFLGNETNPSADFITNPTWSNWLRFGPQRAGEQRSVMWAMVNGWLIPVTGTRTGTPPGSPNDTDTFNILALDPPPSNSGDFRVDYAFLEVWQARIPPNPAVTNKPSASAVWRYGNVEGGMSFLTDDIIDPNLGFETSQRVQLQYRIRVVKGLIGLTSSPDGFDAAVVKAQGAATAATSYTFANMRSALGDPGLWRAGDGSSTAQSALGTIDGYAYAVPMAAIFRRNSILWAGDPSQNLNGGFNRNPTSVDRTGIATYSTVPTLSADLSSTAITASIASATNIPLPITPASAVLIQIGDELLTYQTVTTGGFPTLTGLVRGVNGTRAELHKAGTAIRVISGRPDGLFSDQIAATDVLDLRHVVNPNGFNYDTLLKGNLDRLLRGQMRANWKRSGAGPQGTFVHYQDKLGSGAVSLGVTKLDAFDNIRMVFSDAATPQPIELVVKANGNSIPASISSSWSLQLTAQHTTRLVNNTFSPGDVILIPVAQLKAGLPGGDADQVRWLSENLQIRVDGQSVPLPANLYTVTPNPLTPNDDLTITLDADFQATSSQLYLTLHAVYGPGRGLSRRPDSLHSVSFINPSTELLLQQSGVPSTNQSVRVSWGPLWSKFRGATYKGLLPATSEAYADLGSKSVFVTPFRRIVWPTQFQALDGTAANPRSGTALVSSTQGSSTGTTLLTDTSVNFVAAGVVANDVVIVTDGLSPGNYLVVSRTSTTITLDRVLWAGASPPVTGISYEVRHAQGLMPLLKADGVTAKWATTDPLGAFSGTTDPNAPGKNIYVTLPRHLVPSWGEVKVPILSSDATNFDEGINFMCLSKKGTPAGNGDTNFVQYTGISPGNISQGSNTTYAQFSTVDISSVGLTSAAYNTQLPSFNSINPVGMRFFTDTRGLGRQGFELPPFYGVARLFAVYEAANYKTLGSAYDSSREFVAGKATNLLRQNFDGPIFWVEIDDDGDSTFILNADALDLSRSPNAITSFATGKYVLEASIFGFDRGSFDLSKEFRFVLTQARGVSQANSATRTDNINGGSSSLIAGPTSVLPGPAFNSDQVVINYSRTPYQGDPWGSQTSYIDLAYTPGPLSSATAYQIDSTELTGNALTRPNQKVLEVLASVGFATTLGTGRYSGATQDPAFAGPVPTDFRDVAFEDPAVYPPTSGVAPRPNLLPGNFVAQDAVDIGTHYLGCTERLPLGALFRDKDFRGNLFHSGEGTIAPFVYFDSKAPGIPASLAMSKTIEQSEILLDTASTAIGAPGDAIVQVDGEQGNYSLLVNFRTTRGGSAFTANGGYPGGEVSATHPAIQAESGHTNVLEGRAYLVRNAVTNVGATEVSAGGELMLLVVTSVQALKDTDPHPGVILIGTNGSNEGYAAADLYRIEGHPLVSDNVRMVIDPSTIPLSGRVT